MLRTFTATFALALISSVTLAQASVPPEFISCSRIQNNGERLACYDRAVTYLSQTTDQQTPAPSAEGSFGLQANVAQPPAASDVGEAKSTEVTSITARVTEVTADGAGRKVVTLDNGQAWRELSKSALVSLRTGDEVTIHRAALGSFMMSIPNGRPLRVRRVK